MFLEAEVGPIASWCCALAKKTSVLGHVFCTSLGRKVDLESPSMYSKLFHCAAKSAREF